MYISEHSGHHRACLAIEKALKTFDKDIETKCINSFNYTNPILEKVINRTYMEVIKHKPQIWEHLYDNPAVVKKTMRLKESMHKYASGKMMALLKKFKPDAIVCTQAFPCGIVADIKKTHGVKIPLVAILTDYAPHAYWIYDQVDRYIVPSANTSEKLAKGGADNKRISDLGIPVDPKFLKIQSREALLKKYSLNDKEPVILLMGGGQGLGPIKKVVELLDKLKANLQLIVVTGTNKRLYKFLSKEKSGFKKKIIPITFTEHIEELMEISSLIITKPGGLTTAEALSKNLPMMILRPLPGQEALNTRYLLERGLAIEADDEESASRLLEDLLNRPEKLKKIQERMHKEAKPKAALNIAKLVLGMVH